MHRCVCGPDAPARSDQTLLTRRAAAPCTSPPLSVAATLGGRMRLRCPVMHAMEHMPPTPVTHAASDSGTVLHRA